MGRNKYESIYGDHKNVKFFCARCNKPVKRRINPNDPKTLKVYCGNCKKLKIETLEDKDDHDGGLHWFARMILLQSGATSTKIYRPGEPEFDKIASQCSFAQEGRI